MVHSWVSGLTCIQAETAVIAIGIAMAVIASLVAFRFGMKRSNGWARNISSITFSVIASFGLSIALLFGFLNLVYARNVGQADPHLCCSIEPWRTDFALLAGPIVLVLLNAYTYLRSKSPQ
jgi:hypothetical protein